MKRAAMPEPAIEHRIVPLFATVIRRCIMLGIAVGVLSACSGPDAPAGTATRPDLKLGTVETREVDLTYSTEALVEAVRQSTVAAQIAGRVVDIRFDVGDYVQKGDVIVRIDERAATQAVEASQAQVAEAEAALRNARAQYDRSRQLLAEKFISQAALDKAEAD